MSNNSGGGDSGDSGGGGGGKVIKLHVPNLIYLILHSSNSCTERKIELYSHKLYHEPHDKLNIHFS